MRDPSRIPRILAKLGALWVKQSTDLRLGQLVMNLTRDPRSGATDVHRAFNIEDDDLEDVIDRELEGGS